MFVLSVQCLLSCASPEGGGEGQGSGCLLENRQSIGFQCNTGPDPLQNKKSYQAYIQGWTIFGPQANAFKMAFRSLVDAGPLYVVFGC